MYKLSDKVELIKKCPLFESLSYDEIKLVVFSSNEIFCREGEVLFEEGDEALDAYVILDGEVEVYSHPPEGKRVSIAFLKKYDIFGEFAIISRCPRTAGVRVTRDLSALKIDKDSFFEIIRESPEVSLRIMDTLVHRLITTQKRLLDLLQKEQT